MDQTQKGGSPPPLCALPLPDGKLARDPESRTKNVRLSIVFNAFGALVFAPFFFLFKDFFTDMFAANAPLSRAVANFHTFFNVAAALVFLPLLRPLEKLCALIVKDDEKTNGRTFEKARTFI